MQQNSSFVPLSKVYKRESSFSVFFLLLASHHNFLCATFLFSLLYTSQLHCSHDLDTAVDPVHAIDIDSNCWKKSSQSRRWERGIIHQRGSRMLSIVSIQIPAFTLCWVFNPHGKSCVINFGLKINHFVNFLQREDWSTSSAPLAKLVREDGTHKSRMYRPEWRQSVTNEKSLSSFWWATFARHDIAIKHSASYEIDDADLTRSEADAGSYDAF